MSDSLPAGTLLSERYEVIKVIGQGGMGAVYLAADHRLSVKKWAVKEMIFNYQDKGEKLEFEKLFTDEAHILAGLDHPNLPKVIDFFSEGDRKYLVMEFIEGETLEDLVMGRKDFIPMEKLLDYSGQIMDVLEYLHNRKPNPIIFRDLKPANVMITEDERVKLIDFGIARLFVSGKDKDTVILGTPGYAPPEQYGKSQTGKRSDIFSLGATLYFVLTREDPGKSPFHFPPPKNFNPRVSNELSAIILKAVSISPDSRYGSIREMREEFNRINLESESLATTPLPAMPRAADLPLRFEPAIIDFGTLKSGAVRQESFTIVGDAKGSLTADKKWIKTRPVAVKGFNPVADAIINTKSLRNSGNFLGNIIFTSVKEKIRMPVSVTIEAQSLNFWNYLVAFLLTVFSFIPVAGFLGFFFMLWLYYSFPVEERGALGVFMIITSIISLTYFLIMLVLVAHFYLPKLKGA